MLKQPVFTDYRTQNIKTVNIVNKSTIEHSEQIFFTDFLKLLKREMEKYKLNFTSTINNFYEESFSESHKLLQKIMI